MGQGSFFRGIGIAILATLATVFMILGVLVAAVVRIERRREAVGL